MEYKANSHKAKANAVEKKKNVKQIAHAKERKKNKVIETFFPGNVENVGSYIFTEAIVPAIKKAALDGISMILFGNTNYSNGKSKSNGVSYVSYNKMSDKKYSNERSYSVRDIILESRGECEEVIDAMDDIIDRYDCVTVADLYDLVGISGEFTDNKYGWYSTNRMDTIRVREGYLLKLPRVIVLDK